VKKNIICTLLFNIVTIINGLLLPQLFISVYNSDINGAIVSISQFLSYITFLEAGIGVVVCAALYKPLAQNNHYEINNVIAEAEQFYKKVALIFLGYMFVVACAYPYIVSQFGYYYTFALVIVIGVSTFCQYYFGLSYQLLLNADGKIWINSIINIAAMVFNMIVSIILIYHRVDIILVKLSCSVIYIIRPIIIKQYAKKRYKIERLKVKGTKVLKQKWYGLGHHIAYFVHLNTDVVLLTFFLPISEVSVYSVYASISTSIKSIIKGFSEGIVATLGNLLAKGEMTKIRKFLDAYVLLNLIIVCVLFTVAGLLICPFVELYIPDVVDVDYVRKGFAIILFAAEALYCLRLPYQDVVYASGLFKETRRGAYCEAATNVLLTLPLIKYYGIAGAAMGTFIATMYRFFGFIYYMSVELEYIKFGKILKRYMANVSFCVLGVIIINKIDFLFASWIDWIVAGGVIFAIVGSIVLVGNYILFKDDMNMITSLLIKKRKVTMAE